MNDTTATATAAIAGTPVAAIQANFDKTVDATDFKFRFKKDKLGNQRANVELKAYVPSVEGIIAILEKGGKGLELLKDAISDTVRSAIAADVAEDEKYAQATFDAATLQLKDEKGEVTATLPKYSWEAIANQPREDRRASTIDTETWEAFAKDYQEVMPGVTAKSAEAVANATIVFLKKFSIVKTNKDVLAKLKEQLGLYMEHSKNAEQFSEIIELLLKKVDTYLGADDVQKLVENL